MCIIASLLCLPCLPRRLHDWNPHVTSNHSQIASESQPNSRKVCSQQGRMHDWSKHVPFASQLGHTMQLQPLPRGRQLCQFQMERLSCNMSNASNMLLAVRIRIDRLQPQTPTHNALVRSATMTAAMSSRMLEIMLSTILLLLVLLLGLLLWSPPPTRYPPMGAKNNHSSLTSEECKTMQKRRRDLSLK